MKGKSSVEVGMVKKAGEYVYSSAAHHCGIVVNDTLSNVVDIAQSDWSDWLAIDESKAVMDVLKL